MTNIKLDSSVDTEVVFNDWIVWKNVSFNHVQNDLKDCNRKITEIKTLLKTWVNFVN